MDSPQLRFKDFKLDIEYKELKEFISLMQSGLSRQLKDEDIGLPVLRSNNIQDNSIDIEDIKYWYLNDPQGANTSNYFLEKNDLLVNFINSISQIGKSAIYQNELNRNAILTTNIFRLRFNKLINPLYIGYFFQTKKYFDYIQSITKPAVNQASFTTKEFQKLLVPYVSIEEQTEIANFLTAVDKKILQLNEQHQLMIQYKKGVMQKIFNQEIRFKDDNGKDFGEWEERTLGDVSTVFSGGTPSSTNKEYYKGVIPFIKSGEISSEFTAQFINDEALQNSSAKLVSKGDLLYALYGATSGQVAISKLNGAINQAVLCIRSQLNTYFLYSYLLYSKEKIISTYLQGGQGNLSAQIIKEIDIPIPTLEEQIKIANLFIVLDQKIEILDKQIEYAKTWKKGLLQQMFV